MRIVGLLVLLLGVPVAAEEKPGGRLRVRVDPAVELMSIIFRLAGSPEYNKPAAKSPYSSEVDAHFGRFRGHAVIARAKWLRLTRGISHDAVMSMAVHLEYDGKSFRARVPFDPRPPLLEKRWSSADAIAFLALANDFAARSGFWRFLAQHTDLYAAAVARMESRIGSHAALDWCRAYFGGYLAADAQVTIGLLNGPGNYGVSFRKCNSGAMLARPIVGIYRFDEKGVPVIGDDIVPMLVHEIGHAFVNPFVDRHAAQFQAAVERIYPHRAQVMRRQAYATPRVMIYESIVRACTVRYVARNQGAAKAAALARSDARRGFSWTAKLALLLETYEAERVTYPTMDAFVPKLKDFFEAQALALADAPLVRSISPTNGATDVDPAITKIVIAFDRPMKDKSWSVLKSGTPFPAITGTVSYDRARHVLTIPVRLQPNTRYRFFLNSTRATGFRSEKGTPLAPIEVVFATRAR